MVGEQGFEVVLLAEERAQQFGFLADRILAQAGRYGLDLGWEADPEWTRVPVGKSQIWILRFERRLGKGDRL